MMLIEVPEFSIILLIGDNENQKKHFITAYFKDRQILSLQDEELEIKRKLKALELTIVNINKNAKKDEEQLIKLAKKFHCKAIAIILEEEKEKGAKEVALLQSLEQKGFHKVYIINNKMGRGQIKVQYMKLANNKKEEHGPFDIIGDIHGCYEELCELLVKLGYEVDPIKMTAYSLQNRKVIFLGDLVDRGPKITEVLKLVMFMVGKGEAYCVLGNHDGKLQRKLNGANVQVIHGLEKTVEQLAKESPIFIDELKVFLEGLVSHYVLDEGKLVVAHAGLKEKLHGRESKKIRDLAMFGETTGKTDTLGFPIRLEWSKHYTGHALVVYGHTPQLEVKMINHTINIDTGCVYGGKLTAFRYPENEIVAVKAKRIYYESIRPFL